MKKLANSSMALVLMLLFALPFVSCNDDDDASGGLKQQVSSKVFTGKRLSKIVCDEEDGWYFHFIYDNGLLVRCTEYYGGSINDGYDYLLEYSNKTVKISLGKYVTTFELNSDYLAKSCSGSHNLTFEYDEDNHLIAYGNWRLDYENGNMVKAYPYDASLKWADWADEYTYDTHLNIGGFMPCNYDWLTVYDGVKDEGSIIDSYDGSFYYLDYDILVVAYYAGILGMPTRNVAMVKGLQFDEDGYVAKANGDEYIYE